MLRLIILTLVFSVSFAQEQGEACVNKKTNSPGLCKILEDCPEGVAAVLKQEYPQICGFLGTVPVVCCPDTKAQRKPGDISIQKCKEYSKDITTSECPQYFQSLIVGNGNAMSKEFPHMALLGYDSDDLPNKRQWSCGGSLISERFVLTAAHCQSLPSSSGNVRYIRLGDLNIAKSTDDARPEEFLVDQIISHPDYKPPSRYNDIALLKMDRPATLSPYIRPACLYSGRYELPKMFIEAGWGLIDPHKQDDHLNKAIIKSFTNAECNETYKKHINVRRLKYGIVPETQLCAGGTCIGESGSPIQVYSKDVPCAYDIIGVTDFGMPCDLPYPVVYTRVQHYVSWIENIVWPQ